MVKLLVSTAIAISALASSTAFAAEKTVTLAVKNMYCDACSLIVKGSLEAVPGVAKVAVSYKNKARNHEHVYPRSSPPEKGRVRASRPC